jgi:O-antigen polymerase
MNTTQNIANRDSPHKFNMATCLIFLLPLVFVVFAYSNRDDMFLFESKLVSMLFFTGLLSIVVSVYIAIRHFWFGSVPFIIIYNLADLLLGVYFSYLSISTYLYKGTIINDKFVVYGLSFVNYLLFRMLLANIKLQKALPVIYNGITIVSMVECLVAGLQYANLLPSLNEYFLLTGTFKNPAPLALFLSACLPVSLVLSFYQPRSLIKILSIINVVAIVLILSLTENRASWLAAVIVTSIVVLVRFRLVKRFFPGKTQFALKPLGVIIGGCLLLLMIIVGLYQLKPASADSRILIWRVTSEKIAERPWFGYGYGSFKENYNKWQIDYFINDPGVLTENYFSKNNVRDVAGYIKMAYNEYLEIFAEQGLTGLLLFLTSIVVTLYMGIISLKQTFLTGVMISLLGLVALLIAALFSYPFYSLPTLLMFFIFLAVINSSSGYKRMQLTLEERTFKAALICVIFLIGGLVGILMSIRRHNIYNDYFEAKIAMNRGDSGATELLANLYPVFKDNPNYLLDYSRCLIANGNESGGLKILLQAEKIDNNPAILLLAGSLLEKQNDYRLAETYYVKADLTTPSTIYPKYLLAKLYHFTNEQTKLSKMIDQILNTKLKVKNESSDAMIAEIKALKPE